MRILWKRIGMAVALVAAIGAVQPTTAKNPRIDIRKCPRTCDATEVCGVTPEDPKQCGPSSQGPWHVSTFACCCCADDSKGNWFYGG
jgi:uncharacterized membrane protein